MKKTDFFPGGILRLGLVFGYIFGKMGPGGHFWDMFPVVFWLLDKHCWLFGAGKLWRICGCSAQLNGPLNTENCVKAMTPPKARPVVNW